MSEADLFRPSGIDRATAGGPAPDEVHLWLADLRRPKGELERFRHLLSPDEEARRARFRFERHRRRFLARRGLLRTLLGRYLDRDPSGLEFRYGEQGKPSLAAADGTADDDGLLFNLSDSGEGLLVAVARPPRSSLPIRLGVDLELHRSMGNLPGLGRRVFSPDDARAWYALPESLRETAFLRLWTRKEAILKATGEGILARPRRYSVTLDAASPARLLAIDGDPELARGWRLRHFEPPGRPGEPGYLAALAIHGPVSADSAPDRALDSAPDCIRAFDPRIRAWQWEPP